MTTAPLQVSRPAIQDHFLEICSVGMLAVLMAAVIVCWSPRYWPVTLLHAGIFALGLAWIGQQVLLGTSAIPVRWSLLFVPMAIAALWGLVQLAAGTSVYRFQTSRSVLYWGANAAIMFLGAQFLQSPRVRRRFLMALCIFTGVIAVIGILQFFTSPDRIYWIFPVGPRVKAVGPFVYRNQFAALVELILPIALYRVLNERRQRWIFAMLTAVLFAVVVATASRAGSALVSAEMVLVILLAWRRGLLSGRSLALVLGQVFALVLVFTMVVGYQEVWDRFQLTNPYALRGKLAASTVAMIRSRPVLGYGLGTWQTVYPEFATFDNSLFANEAHNDWAQWTAEGGIVFSLALAIVALGSLLLAWRSIWGLGVVFVFLHSFIDYPTREPVVGAILFVLIGAMISTDLHSGRRRRTGESKA